MSRNPVTSKIFCNLVIFCFLTQFLIIFYPFEVHRDLKPSNILLKKSVGGQVCVKVTDFDHSKILTDQRGEVSMTTGGGGTRGWMSPEMLNIIYHDGTVNILVSCCKTEYHL